MGFFDIFKNKAEQKQDNWKILVQSKKESIRMESVATQRSIYKLLRNTFPALGPFFLTMKEDFDDLNDVIRTDDELNRVLAVLGQVNLRFNAGLGVLKNEAIERCISALNDEDIIMAYIGMEYYRDSFESDIEEIDKTLRIAEKLLKRRFR